MSSYKIEGFKSRLEIMVGWDPMLNTFFAHVIDTMKKEDDEKRDVLWVGCMPNEIYDLDRITRAVEPYAEIPEEVYNQLYSDAHS